MSKTLESEQIDVPVSSKTRTLLIGLDWGTNTSCLTASFSDGSSVEKKVLIPTVVGYADDGILDGILPGEDQMLFGDQAIRHAMHLREVRPLYNGVIEDLKAARDFALHIKSQLEGFDASETRAVIGVPARADSNAREHIREAVKGVFEKVILVPEPFLAALGMRDETKLFSPNYVDPVSNALFIDIGGGSTDLCVIQGYYPKPEDQRSFPFAGDGIDKLFAQELEQAFPDNGLTSAKIRTLKEEHSYVGKIRQTIPVSVTIAGREKQLEIGEQLGVACSVLVEKIFKETKALIEQCNSDSVGELLQNIIITGGGSRIKNIDTCLQSMLEEDGFSNPKVRIAGEDYKEFVALGALKTARRAKERQWQNLIG